MDKLFIIMPNKNLSHQLLDMLNYATSNYDTVTITSSSNFPSVKNKKLLFVTELNSIGFDIDMINFLETLSTKYTLPLYGATAALLVHSPTELSTKRACQDLIFAANNLGCAFIGHSVVEATYSLCNFLTWKETLKMDLKDISLHLSKKLIDRLMNTKNKLIINPSVLVLYSSPSKYSNTLNLWHMISSYLGNIKIKELQIENGDVLDCKGCSYKTCLHYGNKNKCFYGGIMVKEVLPSVEKSDAIVWLCPNYNDALSSNLTATINRLTVLYRKMNFYKKNIFSVIVSGNSGSDSVSKQIIGALNINKGFRLPPNYSIMETANNPNAIFNVSNIHEIAHNFAINLLSEIKE